MMNRLHRLSRTAYRIISIVLIILVLSVQINCSPGGWGKPPVKPPVTDTVTAGASWSTWVLEQIASGIISYATGKSIGWVLSAFGSGGSSPDVSSALQDMDGKLTQIEADLQQIEGELALIAQALSIDTAKILSEAQQTEMSQAELSINNQFTNVQLFAKDGVPGSAAAKTAAQQFADDFLTTGNNDMDANVYTIYGIIMNVNQDLNGGALNALTSMLVAEANDGQLLARYETLESYFNSLLEIQMKGAILMVEALHHRDNPFGGGTTAQGPGVGVWPGTAEQWYNQKFLPQIADEVEEFLRCTDRLVVADADLRTDVGLPVIPNSLPFVNQEPFLPADADTIFSRADFLAAQISPIRHSFGLVVRAVGEPDSINSYVAQNEAPTTTSADNTMHLTPLGPGTDPTQWVKVRLVPVEVWNNWPGGYTQAYMQWNWKQYNGDATPFSDYMSFDAATQIAVAKYEIAWYGAGATTGIDWQNAWPEPVNAQVTTVLYNDKMVQDPSGTHAWGHATLAVRHRPTSWQRYTFNPDSYNSTFFTVTNDYNIYDPAGPNVRLIATVLAGRYVTNLSTFNLESSLTLHIENGMSQQRKATAIVQMQGDANGVMLGVGGNDTMTAWFTGASGEANSWDLQNANGYVYPVAGIFHYWNPGEDTSFHFKLDFNQTVMNFNSGAYVGARVWPNHVYLFF